MQDPIPLIATLRELQSQARHTDLDVDAVQTATQALYEHYARSPEAAAWDDPLQGPEIIGQCAAQHHGRTIIGLDKGHLDEVLFTTVPAKVAAGPEVARPIVDTMRSLYVWLKRECQLPEADEMIELLGDDAIRELEECLSDDALDGPVKAMLKQAMASGVDLSSEQAIKAFLDSKLGTQLPGGDLDPFSAFGQSDQEFRGSSKPPLTSEQQRHRQKKRKQDRKSARKARKKNR